MNQVLCHKSRGRYLIGAILFTLAIGIPQVLAAAEDVNGDWEITMDFNGRQTFAALSITKKPDGTLTGKWGSSDLSNVKFDGQKLTFVRTIKFGDQVSFKTEMGFGDQTFVTEFKAKLDGKTLKGQSVSDRGTNELTGKKVN